MKDIEKKEQLLWWRKVHLEITKTALNFYQKTKDKDFLNYAKWFGQRSVELKDKLKQYE